jgi:GMP reductase
VSVELRQEELERLLSLERKFAKEGLTFDDVLIVPAESSVLPAQASTRTRLTRSIALEIPVVAAAMDTVTEARMAIALAREGGIAVIHRNLPVEAQAAEVKEVKRSGGDLLVAAAVGTGPEGLERASALVAAAVDVLVVDTSHGHSQGVLETVRELKSRHDVQLIAGNVATPEAVIDLENWGADATKVGVGPGKVCITKLKTGFGTGGWQLSALKWCARVATKPIIADGGIRDHGDIAKSIRFGASMVMIGSLFAGHEESPGQTVEVDGALFKEYYGSASDFNKGEYKHVEGKRILEPIKGRFADTLREMREDLQSSISYAGGRVLADLRKVNYVILGGENAGEHLFM